MKNFNSALVATLLLLLAPVSFAAETSRPPAPSQFAGRTEMEGYRFADFAGFEKTWHLVTVRYRRDNGEMRFVYANDQAWKVLTAGGHDYPDGAAFGKIALASASDPAFESSVVPNGTRRYQLMIRNQKNHAATDGWGYALFDAKGETFPEDPKTTVLACAACHRLVPERGFVFSQLMELSPFKTTSKAAMPPPPPAKKLKLAFVDALTSSLPDDLKAELPAGTKKIRLVSGEMRRHLFQGTLDEIRPSLAEEVLRSAVPAILLDESGRRFSAVFFHSAQNCPAGTKGLKGVHNIVFKSQEKYAVTFCQ